MISTIQMPALLFLCFPLIQQKLAVLDEYSHYFSKLAKGILSSGRLAVKQVMHSFLRDWAKTVGILDNKPTLRPPSSWSLFSAAPIAVLCCLQSCSLH